MCEFEETALPAPEAEPELVCPFCPADLRVSAPVLVKTGVVQYLYFYYSDGYFHLDDTDDRDADGEWWECRECGGKLPESLQEQLNRLS